MSTADKIEPKRIYNLEFFRAAYLEALGALLSRPAAPAAAKCAAEATGIAYAADERFEACRASAEAATRPLAPRPAGGE